MRQLPPEGFQGNDESEPRAVRVLPDLPAMPQHDLWTSATFDHSTTGFPLTGAHTSLQCTLCHVNNNYNLTTADASCVNCHLKDFQGTTNPNHVSSGFPQTCQQCHNTTSWTQATFNHNNTGFPLTGAHTTTAMRAVPRQ